jgi:O-antigen/teichoic acid export membrane protein
VSPIAPPRSLTRNTIANLVGYISPLLVAFFAIPVLTRNLGTDRFGVLTLTWVILGYFSLFDFGLGRALTKVVAEKIGLRQEHALPPVVWTSLALMLALGLLGALVAFALAPWLTHDALRIPDHLKAESLWSLYLLAGSIPLVTTTAGLRGILEAAQRFDLVNLLRVPLGAFTFLGPLAVLPFSHSLVWVVAVLLVGRVVAWLAHLVLCLRVVPSLRSRPEFDRTIARPLVRFGTWTSVSNIVGPLMVSMDRFVIGALISVTAVAYYTAPYEVVTKLWMIPGALTGVLFPAFAQAWVQDEHRTVRLLGQGLKYTFVLLFPITLVIIALGHEGLLLWLGPEYARHSTAVLQWLAVGVFLNCLAQIPFALIQAAGRPDQTAKLHLLELPFYLAILWWLIRSSGIEGAAAAWTLRCFVDTVAVFILARRLFPSRGFHLGWLALGTLGAALAGVLALVPLDFPTRAGLLVVALLLFGLFAWSGLLSPEEKGKLKAYAKP